MSGVLFGDLRLGLGVFLNRLPDAEEFATQVEQAQLEEREGLFRLGG